MQHDTCTNTTLIEAFTGTVYSRHPHDLQPGTPDKRPGGENGRRRKFAESLTFRPEKYYIIH